MSWEWLLVFGCSLVRDELGGLAVDGDAIAPARP